MQCPDPSPVQFAAWGFSFAQPGTVPPLLCHKYTYPVIIIIIIIIIVIVTIVVVIIIIRYTYMICRWLAD